MTQAFADSQTGAADSEQATTTSQRRRGRRGGRRRGLHAREQREARRDAVVRQAAIEGLAEDRQDAWAETGQGSETATLTRKLDKAFADRRDHQVGQVPPVRPGQSGVLAP